MSNRCRGKQFVYFSRNCYKRGRSHLDKLSKVEMEDVLLVKSPLIPLGIIASILAIIDIVIRMLRWKDVKDMLIRLKKRKLTNSK